MIVKKIGSGTAWEEIVGYSRGVRVGNAIEIAGTTAVDESGNVVGVNDPAAQTTFIINKAVKAIEELGGSIYNVVRTRIFVTDISRWQEVGISHGEFFKEIKPVVTMVEVSKLIQDDILVEIEFSAIVTD